MKMLEPTLYTPRSSFDSPRRPAGLLTLPVEIRLTIYEYCLPRFVSRPLFVARYPGREWLYRRPNHLTYLPGLLAVNKQIYCEVRDILHKAFGTSDQPIVIEHVRCSIPFEPRDMNNCAVYRSAREIAPVLRTLPRIRLEVEVTCSYMDQYLTIALLKWIRAVLNSRPPVTSALHVPLERVDVIFIKPQFKELRCDEPKEGDGLVQAITGIKTVVGKSEVWYSSSAKRPHNRGAVIKMESGRRIEVSDVSGGVRDSEESAWKGLEAAWRRVKAAEKERVEARKREGMRQVSWGSFITETSHRLMGR